MSQAVSAEITRQGGHRVVRTVLERQGSVPRRKRVVPPPRVLNFSRRERRVLVLGVESCSARRLVNERPDFRLERCTGGKTTGGKEEFEGGT